MEHHYELSKKQAINLVDGSSVWICGDVDSLTHWLSVTIEIVFGRIFKQNSVNTQTKDVACSFQLCSHWAFPFPLLMLLMFVYNVVGFAGVFRGQYGYMDDTLSNAAINKQPSVGHWGNDNMFIFTARCCLCGLLYFWPSVCARRLALLRHLVRLVMNWFVGPCADYSYFQSWEHEDNLLICVELLNIWLIWTIWWYVDNCW